jgi:hypothetical protein
MLFINDRPNALPPFLSLIRIMRRSTFSRDVHRRVAIARIYGAFWKLASGRLIRRGNLRGGVLVGGAQPLPQSHRLQKLHTEFEQF